MAEKRISVSPVAFLARPPIVPRGPEMRAYDQSWRERVAAWLLGDERPSFKRMEFVSQLMGTTGIGDGGLGLVDAIPFIGSTFAANEAVRARDWPMLGLTLMPVGPPLRPPVSRAAVGPMGGLLADVPPPASIPPTPLPPFVGRMLPKKPPLPPHETEDE